VSRPEWHILNWGAAMREFRGSGTPDTEPYAEWFAFVSAMPP
jgi:hypothetical protein